MTAPTGHSRKEKVFDSDPAQVVVALVARLDPTVDRAELAALLCAMVPYPGWRQKIADQLTSRPEMFAQTMTEKMLTYALGRGVDYRDMPAIRSIVHDAARDNFRFSAVVMRIIRSTPFQMRM